MVEYVATKAVGAVRRDADRSRGREQVSERNVSERLFKVLLHKLMAGEIQVGELDLCVTNEAKLRGEL